MNRFDKIEDPRRRTLIEALAAGLLGAMLPASGAIAQNVFGSRPSRLPPGQSVYRITGAVSVNGTAGTLQTAVRPGDTVETGPDGEIVFVIGGHAIIVRANSHVVTEAGASGVTGLLLSGFRMVTGALLSVSRNTQVRMTTGNATIGIRGTGWYAESNPAETYFCTCYGVADIAAINDPDSRETVVATHHDRPVYIAAGAARGASIRNAPFINHTDQELMLIETLVGRTPPFVFPREDYRAPRRRY